VEPGNAEALRDGLQRVLSDTTIADQLTEAGRRRAEDFSMVALAKAYVEIYRRVIGDDVEHSKRVLESLRPRAIAGAFPSEIGDISEFARRLRETLGSVVRSTLGRDWSVRRFRQTRVAPFLERMRRMLKR
jgi:hypothetical protein